MRGRPERALAQSSARSGGRFVPPARHDPGERQAPHPRYCAISYWCTSFCGSPDTVTNNDYPRPLFTVLLRWEVLVLPVDKRL